MMLRLEADSLVGGGSEEGREEREERERERES